MKRLLLIALLAAALLPESAVAREYRIQLGIGGARVDDPGVLVISDSAWLTTVDVGFMAELGYDLFLGFRVGTATTSFSGASMLDGDFGAPMSTLDLAVASRWHVAVTSWLRPFIEVQVGATRGEIEFEGLGISDVRWGAMAGGWAGIELRLPPGFLFSNDFSLGLDLGGGYLWRSPLEFEDGGTKLGTLDLHGALFRVGVTAMW